MVDSKTASEAQHSLFVQLLVMSREKDMIFIFPIDSMIVRDSCWTLSIMLH